ncbi:MAG: polysaccharide deacetylase family protein [Planctomycetota bacterium]
MIIVSTWLTVVAPAAAVGGSFLAWGIAHPRSRIMGPLEYRAAPAEPDEPPRVALTFDDGPTPDSTPAVLDALAEVDAPAAFFVVGRNVLQHPHLVRRIHDDGHVVANHSFDHDRQGLWGLNAFWRRQIDRTDDAVHDLLGFRPAFFRPPMGLKHWHVLTEARYSGHTTVTWTRRGLDGGKKPNRQKIVRRLRKARDGEILLLHDGHEPDRPRSRVATADAVRPLVNQLRDRGVRLVRLDELLGLPAYQPAAEAPTSPDLADPLPPGPWN